MKVLVTGGAGFIGSHLVRALLHRGDAVRVLDNLSSGKAENLSDVASDLELVQADVRDREVCARASEGVEAVFHLAAIGSVPLSIRDPETTHEVNVTGTLNLLIASRDAGVRRFAFASSSAVYGNAPQEVKTEDLPTRPISPYGVSKLAAEAYTVAFKAVYSLETVALRYFNVFGPRQDPNSMYAAVIPRFATSLVRGVPPRIFGDGEQTRDFTYVENVVRANLLSLECPPEACGRAYNIACGKSTSINELFRLLREFSGSETAKLKPVYEPPQPGDVKHSLASIDLACQALGYVPTMEGAEGLRRTLEWYRQHEGQRVAT